MESIILISLRTYSLSQKKPIVKWHTIPYESSIRVPHDYELRMVDAQLKNVPFEEVFNEFNLDWRDKDAIKDAVHNMFTQRHGLVDVVLFIDKLHIAFVLDGYHKCGIMNIESLEALKEKLLSYAA